MVAFIMAPEIAYNILQHHLQGKCHVSIIYCMIYRISISLVIISIVKVM